MTAFALAWTIIQAAEGGARLSIDPDDPGGITKWGISQRSFPTEDIRGLTETRAQELFRLNYWIPCRADELPRAIAVTLVDAAFHQGVVTAIRTLQVALQVEPDGIIGDATLHAAKAVIPTEFLVEFLSRRAKTYAAGNVKYQRGWFKRLFALHQRVLLEVA